MVDLKELKRLIKYLRKEGITEFKSGDIEFKLGAEVKPHRRTKASKTDVSDQVNIDTDGPTKEELLFWSVPAEPTNPKDS